MDLVYKLLQERFTCESFVNYIHSVYIPEHVQINFIQTLDILTGVTSHHEMNAIQNALDNVQYKLSTPDLHTLSLYLATMYDSYQQHGSEYTIVQELLHDVHICEIYERQPSDCPEFIKKWYEVVQFVPEKPMIERLRTCMEHAQIIRNNVCYTYLKDRVEKDIQLTRDSIINELYMSYHIINQTDMNEILTLLEVPEGLQSLLLECTEPPSETDDYVYVFILIGVCLFVSVGIYTFYPFRRKITYNTKE
jgi:hypothetical protein